MLKPFDQVCGEYSRSRLRHSSITCFTTVSPENIASG